jgi:hypothetical protein
MEKPGISEWLSKPAPAHIRKLYSLDTVSSIGLFEAFLDKEEPETSSLGVE